MTPRSTTRSVRRSTAITAVSAMIFGLLPLLVGVAAAQQPPELSRGIARVCPPPGQQVTDEFDDDDRSPHEDSINCVAAYNIAQGFPDGTYRPDLSITRGQMATFIAEFVETARAEELPAGGNEFPDDDESRHHGNINDIAAAGIVRGFPDGTYRADASVSREQMASFIAQAIDFVDDEDVNFSIPPTSTTDFFTDDNQSPHQGNINRLAQQRIVVGVGGGRYNPKGNVTRAQMATFIMQGADYLDTLCLWAPTCEEQPPTGAAARLDLTPDTDTNTVATPHTVTAALFTQQGDTANATVRFEVFSFENNQDTAGTFITGQAVSSTNGRADFTYTGPTAPRDDTIVACVVPNTNTTCTAGNVLTRNAGTTQPTNVNQTPNDFAGKTWTAVAPPPLPTGVATRPELVSAAIVSTTTAAQEAAGGGPQGTVVRYTFDEEVTGTTPPVAGNFAVYTFDGTVNRTGTIVQIEPGGNSVLVRFAGINTTALAAELSVATVDFGAVMDNEGQRNPIGDAAIGAGRNVTLTAGQTAAPDLQSLTNFRPNLTPGFTNQTLVDFVFDEAAFTVNAAGFHLILLNGTDILCTAVGGAAGGVPGPGEQVDQSITVNCPEPGTTDITAADVARGYVDPDTVSDAAQDADPATPPQGNTNPLQAADVSAGGNTTEPDLESATFFPQGNDPDQVVYDFDEPVNLVDLTGARFFVYLSSGDERAGNLAAVAPTRGAASDQVVVTFPNGTLDTAVGASVEDAAVVGATGTAGRQNEEDEVGVANQATQPIAAGRTDDPDLIGVRVETFTGPAGQQGRAIYTFDEDLGAVVASTEFFLVRSDGTRMQCTGTATIGTTEETDNTVTCTGFTNITEAGALGDVATSQQVMSAVLGTVDDGAVTSADPDAGPNPEGAEPTTGGTGTPQQ